jgi:hypothetical protein
MARPGRPERNRAAQSFRQLRRFHHVINSDKVFGTHTGLLRTEREQRARQAAEEIGFGACRGERKADAARGLDDTGGDFQETKTQRRELGGGQFPGLGNGIAHGEHQPIGSGVQHETDLVGERRTATGAVGGELRLVQLDQVFGLAARAIQAVVESRRNERERFQNLLIVDGVFWRGTPVSYETKNALAWRLLTPPPAKADLMWIVEKIPVVQRAINP